MSDGDFDLSPPEPTTDDFLAVPDPRFTTDSVAIVTGGASGIGRATSLALAHNDLTVVPTDVDSEGLDRTVERAADLGLDGEIVPIEGDLTDDDDIESVVNEAADLGELRYVANIAGVQHIDTIPEFPMEKYDLLLDIMLRAPFLVAKHAMSHIRATDDGVGAIANMSSIHGHYATQSKSVYITAKHGLTGLTRAIAAEGEGSLRGFSVSVGYVLTPLMNDQIADTAEKRGVSEREVVENVMLGEARTKEMMTPTEVANLFTFGFSKHCKHLNGADMPWDGGYTHTYE